VLQIGAFGAAFLTLGGFVYRTLWGFGPTAPGLKVLSSEDLEMSTALAEAFFPGPPHFPISGIDVGLPEFTDAYLDGLYPDQQRLLLSLFRVLNLWPLVSYGRTFVELPLSLRREVLKGWQLSRTQLRRAGHQTLRFIYALGYFEDFRVRSALGLRFGCPLPDRTGTLSTGEP
jgi:hypothetical protein